MIARLVALAASLLVVAGCAGGPDENAARRLFEANQGMFELAAAAVRHCGAEGQLRYLDRRVVGCDARPEGDSVVLALMSTRNVDGIAWRDDETWFQLDRGKGATEAERAFIVHDPDGSLGLPSIGASTPGWSYVRQD